MKRKSILFVAGFVLLAASIANAYAYSGVWDFSYSGSTPVYGSDELVPVSESVGLLVGKYNYGEGYVITKSFPGTDLWEIHGRWNHREEVSLFRHRYEPIVWRVDYHFEGWQSSETTASGEWDSVLRVFNTFDGEYYGSGSWSASLLWRGPDQPEWPVASFTYSPEEPIVGEEITFDASSSYDSDGTIISYEWDFGDGNSASGQVVQHSYSEPNEYTATVTVMDDVGLMDSTQQTVVVDDDSEPPKTTHKLSGHNKNAINVKLFPRDDVSEVDVTKYILFKQENVEHYEGTEFTIDLDKVRKILYFSIDKAGNREPAHEITIDKVEESKTFENENYQYCDCPSAGEAFYSVYFKVTYFNISGIAFVDEVYVSSNDLDIHVVGLELERNRNIIKTRSGEGPYWGEIAAVDWSGNNNRYMLYAQLRSTGYDSFSGCRKFLSIGGLPLVISPGGIITLKTCNSDRIFSLDM